MSERSLAIRVNVHVVNRQHI